MLLFGVAFMTGDGVASERKPIPCSASPLDMLKVLSNSYLHGCYPDSPYHNRRFGYSLVQDLGQVGIVSFDLEPDHWAAIESTLIDGDIIAGRTLTELRMAAALRIIKVRNFLVSRGYSLSLVIQTLQTQVRTVLEAQTLDQDDSLRTWLLGRIAGTNNSEWLPSIFLDAEGVLDSNRVIVVRDRIVASPKLLLVNALIECLFLARVVQWINQQGV